MELRVDLDRIALDESTACPLVPFALDTLYFGQKFGEDRTECLVVMDDQL